MVQWSPTPGSGICGYTHTHTHTHNWCGVIDTAARAATAEDDSRMMREQMDFILELCKEQWAQTAYETCTNMRHMCDRFEARRRALNCGLPASSEPPCLQLSEQWVSKVSSSDRASASGSKSTRRNRAYCSKRLGEADLCRGGRTKLLCPCLISNRGTQAAIECVHCQEPLRLPERRGR